MDDPRVKKTIKVKIYGKEYSIRSYEDPEYVEEVARYIDSKMDEIARNGNYSNPIQVAVLAAMNVTDELFATRREKEELATSFKDKSFELVERISSAISPE